MRARLKTYPPYCGRVAINKSDPRTLQIKARSEALQTFVIQLTGRAGYVPTEKAVRGGGYSANVEDNVVGPEGGQVLVDRTVERINSLWVNKP